RLARRVGRGDVPRVPGRGSLPRRRRSRDRGAHRGPRSGTGRRRVVARVVRLVVAGLVALVIAACGSLFPTPPGSPAFGSDIDGGNGTDLDVTILVNGSDVGVAPAHLNTTIPADRLPAKPWSVQAQTASGPAIALVHGGPSARLHPPYTRPRRRH